MDKQEVLNHLMALGSTKEEIAKSLKDLGVTVYSRHINIIGKYLLSKGGHCEVLTQDNFRWLYLSFPQLKGLSEFIVSFNEGEFPYLIK